MLQGCSNLVLYSGRAIAEACSFGAGISGNEAYLHLHHLVQTFPWKIFLAALSLFLTVIMHPDIVEQSFGIGFLE
jgi:hypothetical protein